MSNAHELPLQDENSECILALYLITRIILCVKLNCRADNQKMVLNICECCYVLSLLSCFWMKEVQYSNVVIFRHRRQKQLYAKILETSFVDPVVSCCFCLSDWKEEKEENCEIFRVGGWVSLYMRHWRSIDDTWGYDFISNLLSNCVLFDLRGSLTKWRIPTSAWILTFCLKCAEWHPYR